MDLDWAFVQKPGNLQTEFQPDLNKNSSIFKIYEFINLSVYVQ